MQRLRGQDRQEWPETSEILVDGTNTTPVVLARVRKILRNKKMSCRGRQKREDVEPTTGTHTPRGVCMSIKRKGLREKAFA